MGAEMTFDLEEQVLSITRAYLKIAAPQGGQRVTTAASNEAHAAGLAVAASCCNGTGLIFLHDSKHGRIYEPCPCPAGDAERLANARDKAILHAQDEAYAEREAKERP